MPTDWGRSGKHEAALRSVSVSVQTPERTLASRLAREGELSSLLSWESSGVENLLEGTVLWSY